MEHEKTVRTEILAASPSSSCPDVRFLIVVAPGETDLYEHLTMTFAKVSGVEVIMERRHGDRRQHRQDVASERRRSERRLCPGKVSVLGYTAVHLDSPRDRAVI